MAVLQEGSYQIRDPDELIPKVLLSDIAQLYNDDPNEFQESENAITVPADKSLELSPHPIDILNPATQVSGIFYLKPLPIYEIEKPYFLNIPVHNVPGARQTNVTHTLRDVTITDFSKHKSFFRLDESGFEAGTLRTSLSYDQFADESAITGKYYSEVEDFLATSIDDEIQLYGSTREVTLAMRNHLQQCMLISKLLLTLYVENTHHFSKDQSFLAAIKRLNYFHPEDAIKNAHCRVQIVNVWKSLRGPVLDYPLAVCDYKTVDKVDRVSTDIVFPDYLGETYNFWPNPKHRWHSLDGQQEDEALMIKCFDSKSARENSVAQFAPHVSFPYKSAPAGSQLRESIKVRSFVFHK